MSKISISKCALYYCYGIHNANSQQKLSHDTFLKAGQKHARWLETTSENWVNWPFKGIIICFKSEIALKTKNMIVFGLV